MRKKLIFSIILTSTLVLSTVIIALAGSTIDYGQLQGLEEGTYPPEGEVNWTAWNKLLADLGASSGNGYPQEILTEDNTNCDKGEDIGYSDMGYEEDGTTDPYPEWWILMQNFDDTGPFVGMSYNVIFGGLGVDYSGTLWETSFTWANSPSQTNHGIVAIKGTDPSYACPMTSEQPVEEPVNPGDGRTFTFYGKPGATYHVYRSNLASGTDPANGASNGRYYYLSTETADTGGIGTYTDYEIFDGPAWYLVIEANSTTGAIIGCHSEPVDPTNVRVFDFTAAFNAKERAVDLAWETASELDMLGFNILRSEGDPGERTPVNDELIMATPGGTGALYTYTDTTVEMGAAYDYWLEVVDTDGRTELVGPRSVRSWFEIFIPLINW